MKRRFLIERVGRRRMSAARGMARLGFGAVAIARLLRIRLATAQRVVDGQPAALWSTAQLAQFREASR